MTGANREFSEKYGLWIYLCGETCHRGKNGIHQNRELADRMKRLAQIAFEAKHSHEEWMQIFRKNYLWDEEQNNGWGANDELRL